MKQYRIGAIAKMTGLTVHNLRVWEKRHSAVQTERTETGRRVYSEQALQRLKLLKRCVDQGFSIGMLAPMTDQELMEVASDFANVPTASVEAGMQVCAASGEVFSALLNQKPNGFNWGKVHRFDHIQSMPINASGSSVDLLLLEEPSISGKDIKSLGAAIKKVNARVAVLVYRYARQQDVTYLHTLGVITLKAPIDGDELLNVIQQKLSEPGSVIKPLSSRQPPARRYSNDLLQKAATLSSSIDCECPQHLSEIILGLVAFETYSAQCESKDKAGEDLHRHIYLNTGHARAIMEELLQSVLLQEGIDLSLAHG